MIRNDTANPLNVLNARRVDFCPPYFVSVNIDPSFNVVKALDEWIYNNCSKRYYIGNTVEATDAGIKQKIKVAFEKTGELTYFMLACPYMKYSK